MTAVVFDLDGTLVDSAAGIEWAAQRAVQEVCPQHELVGFGSAIGLRVPQLFARCVPTASAEEITELGLAFRRWYDSAGWQLSPLYPGIGACLQALHDDGIALHLVTNKPSEPAHRVLQMHGVLELFGRVISPNSGPGHADKEAALAWLLTDAEGDPRAWTYVGDTEEDERVADFSGTRFVAALYGYGRSGFPARPGRETCTDPTALMSVLRADRRVKVD